MSAKRARTIGIIALILAIICFFGALIAHNSIGERISSRWEGANGSYSCAGETGVADDIAGMRNPTARATDPNTGDEYLRFGNNVIIVSGEGTPDCRITMEDLDRVNSGTFIWLGGGFAPPAPSGSSGGSSGSGGGVK
ncbi:DUF4247 domain-containing protein [Corynebacterium halotolerans]|uniref:DUF4247 domain-containing protein n=1 Tax=Corynebacterium halotolerans TaxID=225326 RepID=UPI003CF24694